MKRIMAAIQLSSGMDLADNLAQAADLLAQAAGQGAVMAVLPEMFPLLGQGEDFTQAKNLLQETEGKGFIQDFLFEQARRLKLWIIGGTLPLKSQDPHRPFASSLVITPEGKIAARYDKIHLFDAVLSETEAYSESEATLPGKKAVLVDTPCGKMGLSVCFDVRFPELYRELYAQGAELFVVPSAFTVPTGIAHWEVLLRARAIENYAYLIAAAQVGTHGQGRKTYGHSMIIDPTGKIIASLESEPGFLLAEIDSELIALQRKKMGQTHLLPPRF